jgi:hypothetical protein
MRLVSDEGFMYDKNRSEKYKTVEIAKMATKNICFTLSNVETIERYSKTTKGGIYTTCQLRNPLFVIKKRYEKRRSSDESKIYVDNSFLCRPFAYT